MASNNSNQFNQPENERQRAALQQLEKLGVWLDSSISLPGTNFKIGWDTIIGLVPGAGDLATAALSGWIVWRAWQMGASRWTLLRMVGNVGLDSLVGMVPLVGDLFDATYKSNNKNIALLRRHFDKKAARQTRRSNPTTIDAAPGSWQRTA